MCFLTLHNFEIENLSCDRVDPSIHTFKMNVDITIHNKKSMDVQALQQCYTTNRCLIWTWARGKAM